MPYYKTLEEATMEIEIFRDEDGSFGSDHAYIAMSKLVPARWVKAEDIDSVMRLFESTYECMGLIFVYEIVKQEKAKF